MNHDKIIIDEINYYLIHVKDTPKDVNIESRIIDDLNIDSLDMIELGFVLEDKYKLNIDISLFFSTDIKTVKNLSKLIQKHAQVIE